MVLIRQVGLGRFIVRALGPSSTGSKDYGTHNAPLFPSCNFMFFQSRESIVCLNLKCEKLKGRGKLMHTLNVL